MSHVRSAWASQPNRHAAFSAQLCDGPTWDSTAYTASKWPALDAQAVDEGRWLFPTLTDRRECESIYHEHWKGQAGVASRTAEESAALKSLNFAAELAVQTRAFLRAADIAKLGIDGAVVCSVCAGDAVQRSYMRIPFCTKDSVYEAQTRDGGMQTLWWIGNEEYAGLAHGELIFPVINRHFVGVQVAALVQGIGGNFTRLVRLLSGPRYYERNIFHGAVWRWLACGEGLTSPTGEEAWRLVSEAAPLIGNPTENATLAASRTGVVTDGYWHPWLPRLKPGTPPL